MVQPDVIVNNEIVLEFKAVKSKLNGDNLIQLQRYLDLLNIDVGYLVNFWGTPNAEVQRVPLTGSTEVATTPDSSDRETV
jgi:GxxExxY protein